MKPVGVLRFPGTNCDQDILRWMEILKKPAQYLWHQDLFQWQDYSMLILPGGFSYGDYLRSGALAARSPVMKSVHEFASHGGPVLGICNGFQILCEAQLLPGVLMQNQGRRFIDDWVDLEIVSENNKFIKDKKSKTRAEMSLPIAHGDGRYFHDEKGLLELHANQQIWLRYKNNPNGSVENIAGVFNKQKNVAGLMPHPERALFDWMGGVDGLFFLD